MQEEVYVQVKEFICTLEYVGISVLNRKLSIGYGRCSIYLRKMEVEGIIGAMDKDGLRKVLTDKKGELCR